MIWTQTFKKIEKALGFKLHDWQKAYISLESDFMPEERRCGATTAFILRWLLNYGAKINKFERYMSPHVSHGYPSDYWKLFPCDNPSFSCQYVVNIYPRMVSEINYKLHKAGIDTCFESSMV